MPTFTVDPSAIKNGTFSIEGSQAHHMAHVLRIKKGETIRLSDGSGELFEGTVLEAGKKVLVSVTQKLDLKADPHPVHLFISLLKKEKLEWVVEKACELNIEALHFIKSDHSVKTELSPLHRLRLEKIAEAAQKQCGRPKPLVLGEVREWSEALNAAKKTKMAPIFCREKGEAVTFKELFKNPIPSPYGLWIGPEGGWSERELQEALAAGFYPVTLGPLILRAETAALHAISTLLAIAL